ncbi:MAG: serine/threonine-protein kinase, partial [Planctomycetota bacterium]
MSGSRPNIRDYLGRVEPQFQSRLFSELLLLDLEYASKQSVEIDQHELIDQYPEFASNIRKALAHSIATSQTSKFELDRTIEKTAIPDLETAEEPDAALPISCPGYELLGELARGGMGVVYRARQTEANRIVALKMILSGKLAGAAEVTRFKNEARAAANLDHPNIVPVFEIGEAGGQHYYSMGFVNGPSLKETIANDQLDERRSADLIRTVSLAVDYAHSRGIVHRDLKPANILLDEFGKPRITDFGLSKVLHGKADLTGTGQVLGTPAYMSPEQASGRTSQIGIATDIYSLGAILYELLTKRVPFKSKSVIGLLEKVRHESPPLPSSIMPRLSEDLATVCMKCLEKKPEHRYASARALADDLDRFLVGDPIVARPISSGQRFVRWCRRRPVVVGLTACLVASMVVFGSTTIYFAATSKQTFSLVES